MANVIGSGVDALRAWIQRCESAGGVPLVKTKYGGKPLPNSSVIVACWGHREEVPGGEITNIPADVIQRLQSARPHYKYLGSI